MIDRLDLGYRQLFLYTMRHHREMIHGSTRIELKGKRRGAEGIKMPKEVEKLAWYGFASLANRLGFTSPAITALKLMDRNTVEVGSERSKPSFVIEGPVESFKRRSGRPFDLIYEQSQCYLFLDDMHSKDKRRGRGITLFFVRRSIYMAFFDQLSFAESSTTSAAFVETVE